MSLIVESVAKILDDEQLNDNQMFRRPKGPCHDFKTGPPSEIQYYMQE